MRLSEVDLTDLRWDIGPKEAFQSHEITSKEDYERVEKLIESMAGSYIYIDVWDLRPRLALMIMKASGNSRSEVLDQDLLSEEELTEAVYEAGGAINLSGHYPLSQELKQKLKDYLASKEEVKDV